MKKEYGIVISDSAQFKCINTYVYIRLQFIACFQGWVLLIPRFINLRPLCVAAF